MVGEALDRYSKYSQLSKTSYVLKKIYINLLLIFKIR